MRIVVLGSGHIGSVIARDLAGSMPSAKIVMTDKDQRERRLLSWC